MRGSDKQIVVAELSSFEQELDFRAMIRQRCRWPESVAPPEPQSRMTRPEHETNGILREREILTKVERPGCRIPCSTCIERGSRILIELSFWLWRTRAEALRSFAPSRPDIGNRVNTTKHANLIASAARNRCFFVSIQSVFCFTAGAEGPLSDHFQSANRTHSCHVLCSRNY